jgi:hypothetical protein
MRSVDSTFSAFMSVAKNGHQYLLAHFLSVMVNVIRLNDYLVVGGDNNRRIQFFLASLLNITGCKLRFNSYTLNLCFNKKR